MIDDDCSNERVRQKPVRGPSPLLHNPAENLADVLFGDAPICTDTTSIGNDRNGIREALSIKLQQAWEEYAIYAKSCVCANVFPAPFGATTEEKALREEVEQYHKQVRTS